MCFLQGSQNPANYSTMLRPLHSDSEWCGKGFLVMSLFSVFSGNTAPYLWYLLSFALWNSKWLSCNKDSLPQSRYSTTKLNWWLHEVTLSLYYTQIFLLVGWDGDLSNFLPRLALNCDLSWSLPPKELGLQVWATMPSFIWFFFFHLIFLGNRSMSQYANKMLTFFINICCQEVELPCRKLPWLPWPPGAQDVHFT
jgi:hypothetical protein